MNLDNELFVRNKMTREEEYENLPPEEKSHYSSFDDYLGANAQCTCENCDAVIDYDEVDENGYCFDCSEEAEEEDE